MRRALTRRPPTSAPPPATGKDGAKKIDEYAEAEKLLGGPAANPECMWLGRRVVSLLWRDDLDTAFRHLDLYDRFGCPAGHIQTAFRCVVRQGNIDPKAPDRSVHASIPAGSTPIPIPVIAPPAAARRRRPRKPNNTRDHRRPCPRLACRLTAPNHRRGRAGRCAICSGTRLPVRMFILAF